MAREGFNPLFAGRHRLHRAKACADLCVVIALTSVAVSPGHPATQYMDVLGCMLVSFNLIYNGLCMVGSSKVMEFSACKNSSELM